MGGSHLQVRSQEVNRNVNLPTTVTSHQHLSTLGQALQAEKSHPETLM